MENGNKCQKDTLITLASIPFCDFFIDFPRIFTESTTRRETSKIKQM